MTQEQETALEALRQAKRFLSEKQEEMASADRACLAESDEELTTCQDEATRTLREGLSGMAQSMSRLQAKAEESLEQMEVQGRQKRHRTDKSEEDPPKIDASMVEEESGPNNGGGGSDSLQATKSPIVIGPFTSGGAR